MLLSDFLVRYFVGWVAFCVLAAALALRLSRLRRFEWRAWLQFLAVPWKLALFLPAVVFVTFAGAFTDDETWDLVTGGGMAVLTWLTSAWSVGVLYKVARRQLPAAYAVVALAVTLFSSAWFYDGYLLWRDHEYTVRWLGNLKLSPFAYLSAGVVLNLEIIEGRLRLAFTRDDWPRVVSTAVSWKMVALAVPFVLVAVWVLIGFVGWHW